MKGLYRVALMMGMGMFVAAPKQASADPGSTGEQDHELRVVNHHRSPVRVYAEDAEGHMHQLGLVGRGKFKVLEISGEIAEAGFRIKIYPAGPIGAYGDTDGVNTKELKLTSDEGVNLVLGDDLTQSMVQVQKG